MYVLLFHSSVETSVIEAVMNDLPVTATDTVTSCIQPSKQHEPVNARRDTVSSVSKPVEPREHRRPNRPGIVWAVGSKLQARDFLNKWYDLVLALLIHTHARTRTHARMHARMHACTHARTLNTTTSTTKEKISAYAQRLINCQNFTMSQISSLLSNLTHHTNLDYTNFF